MKEIEICFEEARLTYGNAKKGNFCIGTNCPSYKNCKGRIEFDKLPKHIPTDCEMETAINKELNKRENK